MSGTARGAILVCCYPFGQLIKLDLRITSTKQQTSRRTIKALIEQQMEETSSPSPQLLCWPPDRLDAFAKVILYEQQSQERKISYEGLDRSIALLGCTGLKPRH
jgi:hypothetical protein